MLPAKSGILYILEQKLMVCSSSVNHVQFVLVTTACRVCGLRMKHTASGYGG
jgi:hypothetical protein